MTKVVVIFGFLMAFAAGYLVGFNRPIPVATRPDAPGPTTRQNRDRGSELDSLLNLRPDQKEALRKIWSEMAEGGRKHHEARRKDLRRQRDEKIQALLSPEQKSRFEQIHEEYDEQTKALEREMRANFQKAVEATKAVLDPEQRVKYDQWLERRQWGRGPRGGGGGGDRGGDRDRDRDRDRHRDRDRAHETMPRSDAGATSAPSAQP